MTVELSSILIVTIINGIIALYTLGAKKRIKEEKANSMEANSEKVKAETIQHILESARNIIGGYKELAIDIEKENKLRDAKIKALQTSLIEAKTTIEALVQKNENLTRISMATCAGIELLIAQLKKEGLEPVWEVASSIKEILRDR